MTFWKRVERSPLASLPMKLGWNNVQREARAYTLDHRGGWCGVVYVWEGGREGGWEGGCVCGWREGGREEGGVCVCGRWVGGWVGVGEGEREEEGREEGREGKGRGEVMGGEEGEEGGEGGEGEREGRGKEGGERGEFWLSWHNFLFSPVLMHTWSLRPAARLEAREAQVSHITLHSSSFFFSSFRIFPSRFFPGVSILFAQAFTVPALPP